MGNVIENNKLIAEFMGLHQSSLPYEQDCWYDENNHLVHGTSLRYHTSWDWLMPVVEKIERLGNETYICYDPTCGDYLNIFDISRQKGWHEDILTGTGNTKVQACYNAIIQFIKWYNLQTP